MSGKRFREEERTPLEEQQRERMERTEKTERKERLEQRRIQQQGRLAKSEPRKQKKQKNRRNTKKRNLRFLKTSKNTMAVALAANTSPKEQNLTVHTRKAKLSHMTMITIMTTTVTVPLQRAKKLHKKLP